MSILDLADISIGEDRAKALVDQELLISPDKIVFGNRRCQKSSFLAERVETNIELSEKARVGNEKLRLPNPVIVVELSCAYVYIKSQDRMVFAWNGVFFDIKRTAGPALPSRLPARN